MKKIIFSLVLLITLVGSVFAECMKYNPENGKFVYYSKELHLTYECSKWSEGFGKLLTAFGNNYQMIENNKALAQDVKNILYDSSIELKDNTICWAFVSDSLTPYLVANWYNKETKTYTTIIWFLK